MTALRTALAALSILFALFAPRIAAAQAAPERVSILQFIPKSEWPAIAACTSHYDVTAAKDQADRVVSMDTGSYSLGSGEVDWPAGCYFFAHTLEQKLTVLERGVSSGLPSGGSTVWKFPPSTMGIVIDRADTVQCRRAPKTTSGGGTQLIGITLIGGGGSPDATSHGVWMCATAQLTDVNVQNFAGDGVHIDSNGVGNANMFRVYNGFIQEVGRYGLFERGSDANAGLIVGTGVSHTGGGCDIDLSFLGNTHVGELCQYTGVGLTRVNVSGVSYQCLTLKCGEVAPGKDQTVWYPVPNDPHYPAYTPGAPYLIAGDYVSLDPNARSIFLGVYAEGGDAFSDVRSPAMVQGGIQGSGFTRFSVTISPAQGLGGYVGSSTGFGGLEHRPDGRPGVEAVIGGNPVNGDVVRSASHGASEAQWRLRWAGADLREDWDNLDNRMVILRTGPKTAQTFARETPQPGEIALPRGVFLSGGSYGDLRYVGEASAMPKSGDWAKGDRVFNNNPQVLGPKGAQYTVTGWLRLTKGSNNAPGVDWVEMRSPTGS
jgi:hypothetical protein